MGSSTASAAADPSRCSSPSTARLGVGVGSGLGLGLGLGLGFGLVTDPLLTPCSLVATRTPFYRQPAVSLVTPRGGPSAGGTVLSLF